MVLLPFLLSKYTLHHPSPLVLEKLANAKELWQEGQTLVPGNLEVNAGIMFRCVTICKLPNLSEPQLHHCEMGTIVPTQ